MPINERAALRRQGGGERAEMGITASCREQNQPASRDRVISDWLDAVELRASPDLSGSTERKVSAGIVDMLPSGRDSLVASLAEIGAASRLRCGGFRRGACCASIARRGGALRP